MDSYLLRTGVWLPRAVLFEDFYHWHRTVLIIVTQTAFIAHIPLEKLVAWLKPTLGFMLDRK